MEVRRHPVEPAGPNGLRLRGDRDAGSPFGFFAGAQAMTRATEILAQREDVRRIPVLKPARLTLRAPRRRDAKAIARFAGDRRVAENTVRVPHPYTIEAA